MGRGLLTATLVVCTCVATACHSNSTPSPTAGASAGATASASTSASSRPEVPSVTGVSAESALTQLHDAGFATVRFDARRSPLTQGRVLGQHPSAGTDAPLTQRIELTVSAGRHPAGTSIGVPGIGTCQMDQIPSSQLCVGGPVYARVLLSAT